MSRVSPSVRNGRSATLRPMRWTRRSEKVEHDEAPASGWHEGAHWVAGATVVVNAERAADLVAKTSQAA